VPHFYLAWCRVPVPEGGVVIQEVEDYHNFPLLVPVVVHTNVGVWVCYRQLSDNPYTLIVGEVWRGQ